MRSNRLLWVLVEKVFGLINDRTNKRGLILNYSVINTNPPLKKPLSQRVNNETGIVIQGPIMYPDFLDKFLHFCLQTYPRVPIVISTWTHEENLNSLKNLDRVILVQSERPSTSGVANLNYQVTSTLAGFNKAIEQGCKSILKMRSDQGLFASNFLDQFVFAAENAPDSGYRRIITTDFNSFLFRLNSPSDQIQFANTQTLLDYWGAHKNLKNPAGRFPEEILLLSYLASIGLSAPTSLSESLEVYRDHFVFLDSTDLGLVWRKGSWRHPDSRFEQLDRSSLLRFVSPDEWRRLQTDLASVLQEAKKLGDIN